MSNEHPNAKIAPGGSFVLSVVGSVAGRVLGLTDKAGRLPHLSGGCLNRSTQHCIKSFCWGFNSQGFTWPFVELTHHSVYMGL
jgi:hypothetical protein